MHRLLQLTLDFFDSAPASAPPRTRRPQAPGPGHRDTAARHLAADRAAGPGPAARCLSPSACQSRGACWAIPWSPTSSAAGKRRNIGFMVGPEGLTVSAPKWVPLLRDRRRGEKQGTAGSSSKLGDAHERQRRVDSARIEWKDGATFPLPRRAGDPGAGSAPCLRRGGSGAQHRWRDLARRAAPHAARRPAQHRRCRADPRQPYRPG